MMCHLPHFVHGCAEKFQIGLKYFAQQQQHFRLDYGGDTFDTELKDTSQKVEEGSKISATLRHQITAKL